MEAALPELPSGSTAAAIHFLDDAALCASVRGSDSLTVFRLDASGRLGKRTVVPSGGSTPRDFLPAGDFLLAANQGSDEIIAFCRTPDGLQPMDCALPAIHPTCLRPI